MPGKSVESLHDELRSLEAEADALATRLISKGINSQQLVNRLMPISKKISTTNQKIRDKTKHDELVRQRNDLQKKLRAVPSHRHTEKLELKTQLASIDFYLKFRRKKPVTLRTLLMLIGIVILMIYVPNLIIDLLAP